MGTTSTLDVKNASPVSFGDIKGGVIGPEPALSPDGQNMGSEE